MGARGVGKGLGPPGRRDVSLVAAPATAPSLSSVPAEGLEEKHLLGWLLGETAVTREAEPPRTCPCGHGFLSGCLNLCEALCVCVCVNQGVCQRELVRMGRPVFILEPIFQCISRTTEFGVGGACGCCGHLVK